MVQDLGLDKFYAMTAESRMQPASNRSMEYSVYDADAFQAQFVKRLDELPKGMREASLLIEGLTCYACVWLIRQALEKNFSRTGQNADPINITINLATGAAILTWQSGERKLSELVQFIESLGYSVLPHRGISLRSDHNAIIRVGVGLFVMVNVMSFALAEYFAGSDGLEPGIEMFLRWLSLSLTILSLAWPGREFFTNTWRAAITRTPSIDAPILIGLVAATIWSIRSTVGGQGPVYYDSICAIVALVITGRFVQQNVLRRNQTRMAALVNPRDGWVLAERSSSSASENVEGWAPVQASSIKKGELIRVLPGEMFPVRVSCVTSCAEVSFEQLRGEAEWKTMHRGDEIPAGALNGAIPVDVIATQNGAESYTESLARAIDRAINEKGLYNKWSDRAAWILFLVVFLVATVVMITIGSSNPEEAIRRTVAILLVACPCTFAIGVPLAFGTAMTQALREGVLFKSQRALEKLASIHHFIFDKTGTLTEGKLSVQEWTWLRPLSPESEMLLWSRISEIDLISSHHVARAVAAFARGKAESRGLRPFASEEFQGLGLEARFSDGVLQIGKTAFLQQLGIILPKSDATGDTWLAFNGELLASILLEDGIRTESASMINDIKNLGRDVEILSGDTSARTQAIAKELAINPPNAHGEATPSTKMLFVRNKAARKPSAMVGNGLNDAGAMAQAEVSIAVAGSSSTAMNSADICLLKPDVKLVSQSLKYSLTACQRMRRIFGFALFYNIIGLSLAAMGYVTPVVAAILMPISSLTVTHVATAWSINQKPKQRTI